MFEKLLNSFRDYHILIASVFLAFLLDRFLKTVYSETQNVITKDLHEKKVSTCGQFQSACNCPHWKSAEFSRKFKT